MENLNKHITISIMGLLITFLLGSCALTSYTYDPIYEDRPHTTEVYWHTDYEIGGTPYFGYWDNFYYYYGVPHFYPWWYYYQFIPPYYYYANTHIIITIESGYYVYGHRGPKFHNIGPDCPTNKGKFTPTIKSKKQNTKSNVFPRDWKSSNSTRTNKQNNIKYNINKINYNRTFNFNNTNKSTNSNKNRSNISKPNRSNKKRP